MRRQFLSPRSQLGQAIVLIALMIIGLTAAVGLAVDAGIGYYWNTAAERAAAAGALSGVIFMPNQQTPAQAVPAGSRNDATDRAVDEAKRNGFDPADVADGVTVTVAAVPGYSNKLSVTVTRNVRTFFMGLFGVTVFPVKRTAIATYLPPLSLGQPGSQIGSTVSSLGTGNNFYFMRNEGWSVDRSQGDAFTPDPADPGNSQYSSNDVHVISAANNTDNGPGVAGLPSRGGYNYLVNLPAGGSIQVYNAAFAPDGNGGKPHNHCENNRQGSPTAPIGPCSSGGSYYFHEEDSVNFSSKNTFNAIEYTLFKVNSYFIRSGDTKLTQFKVLPIDASNWNQSSGQYRNVNTGASITQTYNADGSPANMLVYHNWIDVTAYAGSSDGGIVQWTPGYGPWAPGSTLPAGTYRLRVDSLNYDGSLPPTDGASGPGLAHKGYAVRVLDASGNPCSSCAIGAWDDMCIYTPISTSGGGAFTIPIFQVPPDYAGQTITLDIFDPGDISGGGNVDLYILDPSGAVAKPTPPATVLVQNLGPSRTNPSPATVNPPLADPTQAYVEATTSGVTNFNGSWVRLIIPISATYSPGPNPANWWWSLQYKTTNNVTATDTVTFAVGLRGNPAHLLQS